MQKKAIPGFHIPQLCLALSACVLLYCCPCAAAADQVTAVADADLVELMDAALPEVEPDEDYVVRYTDQAVDPSSEEGEHWALLDGEELEAAIEDGTVAYYEEDAVVTLLGDSESQWEHASIHLDFTENLDADGRGVTIGVIDSGIYAHSELEHCLLPGYNYIDNNENTTDTYGHGTGVAGVLAAACNGTGISGIAPGVKLVPLKAFSNSETTISSLIAAIYGAVDTFHCDVINMSFGTTSASNALRYAVEYADQQGVIMVAAVGNSGSTTIQYPAGYDCVIGVGSVDENGTHAYTSQRNKSVFISAPGALVSTTTLDNGYGTASGTSFSAPIVSGAIADLLSIDPSLTSEQLQTLLSETAADAGDEGYDTSYGWGILDLKAAASSLLGDSAVFLAPLTISDAGQLQLSLTRLSGSWSGINLVTARTSSDGTLLAASSAEYTLDQDGKLTTEISIPAAGSGDQQLLTNFNALTSRQLLMEDGSALTVYAGRNGWNKISGKWYYYETNELKTGWLSWNGSWYYLNPDGSMKIGWLSWHGNWYYLNADGSMKTGWLSWYGNWYYLKSDGSMKTGWLSWNGNWYYLKSDGSMKTGWLSWNGNWYYLDPDSTGAMLQDTAKKISGKNYSFDSNGVCAGY